VIGCGRRIPGIDVSAFNELILLLTCECGHVGRRSVQFRYGRVWWYSYSIGSTIERGSGAVGSELDQIAAVQGWLTGCERCSNEGDLAVLVRSGAVIGVTAWENIDELPKESVFP